MHRSLLSILWYALFHSVTVISTGTTEAYPIVNPSLIFPFLQRTTTTYLCKDIQGVSWPHLKNPLEDAYIIQSLQDPFLPEPSILGMCQICNIIDFRPLLNPGFNYTTQKTVKANARCSSLFNIINSKPQENEPVSINFSHSNLILISFFYMLKMSSLTNSPGSCWFLFQDVTTF